MPIMKKGPYPCLNDRKHKGCFKMFKCKIELRDFAFKINGQEKFSMQERPEGEIRREWVKQRGQGREVKGVRKTEEGREWVLGEGEESVEWDLKRGGLVGEIGV